MGTGGFRYGAGRPGWRRKCERCYRLDVRKLAQGGHLRPGMSYGWQWSRDGERTADIGIRVEEDRIFLSYQRTLNGSAPEQFTYPLWIERTPCRFGGTRAWFSCPRCAARRAVLYGLARDGRFGCRACMRLAYASEVQDPVARTWRKQQKLEARLIGDGNRRPRMRESTFEHLCEKIEQCEARRDELLLPGFVRLLTRWERWETN